MAHQKSVGQVEPEDISLSWKRDGGVRAMIFDKQLYILEAKYSGQGFDSPRALAILHALHRAIITSPEETPNIEFAFSVNDVADKEHKGGTRPIWALSRTAKEPQQWLMSDFGYWSWPLKLVGSYDQIRREIGDTEIEFAVKKKQAVWRGSVKTNRVREDLIRITKGKKWADVSKIEWSSATAVSGHDVVKALSIPDHCQYQFVIQTEGM